VLAALAHRARTGQGQMIDLSMTEAIAHHLGAQMLRVAAGEGLPPRTGNRSVVIAPQGVYPCAGDDQWVALSVSDGARWRALCNLIGDPRLADPALEDVAERRRRHDAVDACIADWTRQRAKDEAARLLQEQGIAAGPVQRVSDLPHDPQYQARDVFQQMAHRRPILGYGWHPQLAPAWQVAGRRRPKVVASDGYGADNRRILKRWLGMSAREVTALERCGALVRPRRLAITMPSEYGASGGRYDPDFAERLGMTPEGGEPA
jgi:benzylsuccinate CoA-transferase BbsF subunit